MAQTTINVGVTANDGTGDEIRRAGIYINANFTELFALEPVLSHINFEGNEIKSTLSNADINLEASGTGVIQLGAGIKINDNNIEGARSNDNIKFIPQGTGGVAISGVKVAGNNIYATRSNDDLVFSPSGSGNVVFADLQILSNNITSTRSNDDIKITPSGTGDVVLSSLRVNGTTLNSDDSTKITLAEAVDVTGALVAATSINIAGDGATVTGILDEDAMGSDSNVKLATQQSIKAYADSKVTAMDLDFQGDSGGALSIDLNSESLTFAGAGGITADGATNTITVNLNSATGLTSLGVGSLTFAGNDITSSSNADINITPGGTGVVNMSNTTIGGNIKLFDNTIQTTQSNANLELNPSGSGSVNVTSGMTTAAITTSANVSITGTETITGQLDVEGVTIKDNTISTNASNAHLEISGNGSGNVVIDDVDIGGGFIDNVVIGGVTPAAGTFTAFTTPTLSSAGITITDNVIKTNSSNANLEFSASGSGYVVINGFQLPNADGGTGQVLRTDGSAGLTWVTSPILLGASDIQDGTATVGFSTETVVDPNVSTGKHESITTTASTINEYASTKYDSTFWIALTRMEAADSSIEFALAKYSLLHGTDDGSTFDSFNTHSSIVRTGEEYSFDDSTRLGMDEHIKTSTDIASNNVRLKGQGGYLADGSTISSTNAISFYRIGLGDDDSSVTRGKATTVVNADVDSAVENLDTWAHASYRGAKYYISVNNTTSNEVSNIECIVVHNGSDAFILSYNEHFSGNNSLLTLTADISGSDVRLRGAGGPSGTTRVTMYRILLADNESNSSGTNVNLIGATSVTNTGKTTIDTNSFRGTATPNMTSQKVVSSFTNTDYDSVWYHAISKDSTNTEWTMNKYSLHHGVTSDGSTLDAFITDSSVVRTGNVPITTVDAGINSSTIELKATGYNDGSSTIQNALSYYGIGLGSSTPTATSGKISTHAGVTLGGNNETKVDHVIASGTVHSLLASERTVASFTASQFNGALYHVVTRDLNGTSFEIQKISVLHNFADAWVTSSSVVQTDLADQHPTFDADITATSDSTATVRLRATDSDGSTTPSNTMAYYRIGIGDDDSTGYVGELGLVHDIMHISIIDSAVTNLDTWTHASHVGAKYFINVRNQSTGETSNIEALVTHNNTDAFITTYNEHFSGNNSLITLTADISGTSVRLRGSATAGGSTKVVVNRVVAFGDTESTEATEDSTRKVIGNVVTSSAATEFDTFQSSDTDAVHYVITGQGGTNENYICEADVVTDGTGVFVSQGPTISTKTGEVELLIISATISGGIVSVKAASTSGATVVQAYAVRLKAPTSQVTEIDTWAHGSSRGAKYYISAKEINTGYTSNIECLVVHNGTTAYITSFNEHFSNTSLVTLTADIDGSNVRLLGTPSMADVKIKFYKILLGDSESDATATDSKVVGAVTVSSASTTIDTFVDTSYTGAHYVIVGHNSSEGAASICEATVLTDGTTAYVAQGPNVSSKGTDQILLTAAHDGSSTVTLSATSTSGGSTTVNAYRIHMLRGDGTDYTKIDSYASASYQGAHYIVVGKNAANESMIAEIQTVTDGTGAYHNDDIMINTHSTSTNLLTFSTAYSSGELELRAMNTQENTTTTVNAYRVHLERAEGDPSTIKTLDTWDSTTYRSAKYNVSVSDAANTRYEYVDVSVTHDGSTPYVTTFGRVTNHSADLITFSATLASNTVSLKGQISNTDDHVVKFVRRVIEV